MIMVGKRKDLRKKYFEIFMLSLNSECTLEEIGVRYNMTKQRAWQIVRFNELGNGDYYYGVNVARDKWSELYSTYKDKKQTRLAFNEWLENNQIKLIGNNKTTAPHTGWDLL